MPHLTGCGNARQYTPAEKKPIVSVTIPPQAYILRQIAGEDIDINIMLPPGTDPESAEPLPEAMRKLEYSREYVMLGEYPFEQALRQRIASMIPQLQLVSISCNTNHNHGKEHEHNHESGDPHIWMSPESLHHITDVMYHTAVRCNPDAENRYRANATQLHTRIDAVRDTLSMLLAPLRGKSFVIWHPSLTYFAREYGIVQLPVESEGKETTPRQMMELIDKVRHDGAIAFVVEREHSPRMAEALNRDMQLPMIRVDLMQGDILASLVKLGRDLRSASVNNNTQK